MQLNAKLFVASILGISLLFASAYFVAALRLSGPSHSIAPNERCSVPMIFSGPTSDLEDTFFSDCEAPKCPSAPTGACKNGDKSCKESDSTREVACLFKCVGGVWQKDKECGQNACKSTTACQD